MPKKSLISLFLMLIFWWATPSLGAPDFTKTPVFFVHGYGMSAESWQPLITYLQPKSGNPSLFLRTIQLFPDDGSNIKAAENQIKPAIEEFLKDVNEFLAQDHPDIPLKTKVDLVSHSMGGLSSRWYTAKVRPDRVHKWISLAGANHGTDVLCGWAGQGANDLCPAFAKNTKESLIQYLLNGKPKLADIDETPYGLGRDSAGVDSILPDNGRSILYVSIRTSPDEWINPETSPILDGAGGIEISIPENIPAKMTSLGNVLMTNGVGHDAMLSDGDTMKLVKSVLDQKDAGMPIW